jgi:hypothetical protein
VRILFEYGKKDFANQTERTSPAITSSQEAVVVETHQETCSVCGTTNTKRGTIFSATPQSMKPLRFYIALKGQSSPKWRGSGSA